MVKIEKIILKIGTKELELGPEEVKELKEALDKMFRDEKIIYRYYPYYPGYYYAPYPDPNGTWPPDQTFTVASGNATVGSTTLDTGAL